MFVQNCCDGGSPPPQLNDNVRHSRPLQEEDKCRKRSHETAIMQTK